jgi:hypothetical protein
MPASQARQSPRSAARADFWNPAGWPDQRIRTGGVKPLLNTAGRLLEPRRVRIALPISAAHRTWRRLRRQACTTPAGWCGPWSTSGPCCDLATGAGHDDCLSRRRAQVAPCGVTAASLSGGVQSIDRSLSVSQAHAYVHRAQRKVGAAEPYGRFIWVDIAGYDLAHQALKHKISHVASLGAFGAR